MFESKLYTILMDDPSDVSGLEKLINEGEIDPKNIKGIMVMHEGDGFSRAYTSLAFALLLSEKLSISRDEVKRTVPIQAIAGMAGLMVPHVAVFTRREVDGKEGKEKRFVVAGACTREILPEEVGTMTYVREVAKVTRELMKDAQIDDPKDVHFVFAKGPWPSGKDRREVEKRGKKLMSNDRMLEGEYARGSSALGVALGLGEAQESQIEGKILQNKDEVYSLVAHCSCGGERNSVAVILMGNTTKSTSDLIIGHGLMKDVCDAEGVKEVLKSMGFKFDCCPSDKDLERVLYAFVKPKAGELPTFRGYRHTLYSDSVLGPHGWNVEKAPAHAVVTSVLNNPLIEVASGPEHQMPPGYSGVAIIAKAE